MLRDDEGARARVGSVLNEKWALEKLLGVGGMGAVYAARHTRNVARAAVKVLHPELARHVEVRERFLREGRAANTVEHPGVVKVIDDDQVKSGPDEGATYLVMELLEGASLEDRIEVGPKLDERELLGMMDAVLDVLTAAHARGVVHRDLKPENLFLAKDATTSGSRWMVLDFGLARLADSALITERGMALGTPSYMSPEQAGGRHGEVDGRTDLFALAATAFRVLSGRRVHEAASPLEVVLKMANAPAPALRDVAPQVSMATARVIDRALQFRREDRYPDAAGMRTEVQRAIVALEVATSKTVVETEPPTLIAAPRATQPAIEARPEPTLELSVRDLEPVKPEPVKPEPVKPASPARAPLSSATRPPVGARESSISIPGLRRRRPSFIPLLTALFFGGLVIKLAVDAERSKQAADAVVAADAGVQGSATIASGTVAPAIRRDTNSEAGTASDQDGESSAASLGNTGTENDARAAEGGDEDAEAADAGEEADAETESVATDAGTSPDERSDAEAPERSTISPAPRATTERRRAPGPPPGHVVTGAPPPHKPKHPKPHFRHD